MSDQNERLLQDSNESEEEKKDYGSNTQSSETSVDLTTNFNNKHQPNAYAILKKPSIYPRKSKPPKTIKTSVHDLLRSSTLSFFLLIGYAINFVSITSKSITSAWSIIYVSSLGWLFFSCLLIIFMSLCNYVMTTTHRKIFLITLFLFGFIGYTTSLILGLFSEDNNGYICWEFELLYILLPLYMIVLIYFFGKSNKRSSCINMIKLVIFSFILCTTPLVRLIQIGKLPELSLPLSSTPTLAYSAVCVATFLVISTHSICYMRRINSGVFFKFIIVCGLLMCSIVICIRQKIDFDKYTDSVRIYYYYALLIALYVMYLCELLIEPPPKIIKSDMLEHLKNRKSFAIEMLNVPAFGNSKETSIEMGVFSVSKSKSITGLYVTNLPFQPYSNPNKKIKSVIKIFPDKFPCQQNCNKYFDEITKPHREDCDYEQERLKDSITVIVPFYNEQAREVHATLRSLYLNFNYIRQKDNKYEFTHFNVLLVGDGWFKAHTSTKQYLAKLYHFAEIDKSFKTIVEQQEEYNTVILQTEGNKALCINPFDNGEENMMMKVTTIIKIDNRKKANSHQWFLGKYGFAEWCDCDYMYFTDAYSTLNPKGLYQMLMHMNEPKNKDVICCTGRARVYSFDDEYNLKKLYGRTHKESLINVEQKHEEKEEKQEHEENEGKWWENEIFFEKDDSKKQDIMENDYSSNIKYNLDIEDRDSDHRLSINAHVRQCQMFEFEALYATIGCYLLGGFLPVIPGPCGFYRGKNYLLEDEVRNWYFDQINKENDPENIDLLLGNMKLAEDRILTITSILNYNGSVRHSLIPECVFYFDPMPNLTSLMKQRRRWINGSIATIIYVLRKVPFSRWKVSVLRRWYVLSIWYMQLIMYTVLFLSPPILFIISFQYGLASILSAILVDNKEKTIDSTVTLFMIIAWLIYTAFIYAAQRKEAKNDRKFKQKIVKLMLFTSYAFGVMTMIGFAIQFVDLIKVIINPTAKDIMENSFDFFVLVMGVLFFMQSFILAPLFSKDITTLTILLKTFLSYFFYAPFYVILFFINAICNVHDLSWGTRPDNPIEETGNPKHTTYKIIAWLLLINIITAIIMQPFTEGIYSRAVIFILLSLPSLFQIFFALLWLIPMRFMDVLRVCLPKRVRDVYDYQIENYQ